MWPFEQLARRFNRGRHAEPSPSPEALQARRQAAEGLCNEIRRGPEVARVTESLRSSVIRNHFSEAMEHLVVIRSRPGEQ